MAERPEDWRELLTPDLWPAPPGLDPPRVGPQQLPTAPEGPRPEMAEDWWARAHPDEEAPDFNRLINEWYRSEPEGFRQFNTWHEETYGYPAFSLRGGGFEQATPQRNVWEPTPEYRRPGAGPDTRINIPNVGRAMAGPFADIIAGTATGVGDVFREGDFGAFPEGYHRGAVTSRAAGEAFREEHPVVSYGAELSAAAIPAFKAGQIALRGGNAFTQALRSTTLGGLGGFAYGAADAPPVAVGTEPPGAQPQWPPDPSLTREPYLGEAFEAGMERAPYGAVAGAAAPLVDRALAPMFRQVLPPTTAGRSTAPTVAPSPGTRAGAIPMVDRISAPPVVRTQRQVEEVRDNYQAQGREAFQLADASGIRISNGYFGQETAGWRSTLDQDYSFHPTTHPQTAILLRRIERDVADGRDLTWGQFDNLYKDIGDALGRADSRDATMLYWIRDNLVDLMANAPPSALTTPAATYAAGGAMMAPQQAMEAFRAGQESFRNFGRLDIVNEAMQKAAHAVSLGRASEGRSVSFGHAFREQMEEVWNDPSKRARFTDEQREIINRQVLLAKTPGEVISRIMHVFTLGASPGAAGAAAAFGAGGLLYGQLFGGPDALSTLSPGFMVPGAAMMLENMTRSAANRSARDRLLESLANPQGLNPSAVPPLIYGGTIGAGIAAGDPSYQEPPFEAVWPPRVQ